GLRSDKPAAAITREVPAPTPRGEAAGKLAARPKPVKSKPVKSTDPRAVPALPGAIKVTHPERVIDAKSGLTKRDLVDYYLQAAPRILPHLKGRPVALVRAPAGVGGQHFFQKHSGSLRIAEIVELPA